jgi:hypothetical protein
MTESFIKEEKLQLCRLSAGGRSSASSLFPAMVTAAAAANK